MILSDFIFLSIIFMILLTFFFINFSDNLLSLIISELVWITLFVLSLLISLTLNNILILSLTLFFLVFSAIEISTGLVLINAQKLIFKSTSTESKNFKINNYQKKNISNNYLKKYFL